MRLYRIKKGKHSSFRLPKFLFGRKFICASFRFDPSCLYELEANKGQINKLFGYGHSIRIGWRGEDGRIRLYKYYGSASISGKSSWVYYRDIQVGVEDGDCLPIYGWFHRIITWVNFPYFGGKEPAPHDMRIELSID